MIAVNLTWRTSRVSYPYSKKKKKKEGSVVVASVREKMKQGLVCGKAYEKIREKCLR